MSKPQGVDMRSAACFYSFGVSEPISKFTCAICSRVHIWKQD
jgi:hypothetical protein